MCFSQLNKHFQCGDAKLNKTVPFTLKNHIIWIWWFATSSHFLRSHITRPWSGPLSIQCRHSVPSHTHLCIVLVCRLNMLCLPLPGSWAPKQGQGGEWILHGPVFWEPSPVSHIFFFARAEPIQLNYSEKITCLFGWVVLMKLYSATSVQAVASLPSRPSRCRWHTWCGWPLHWGTRRTMPRNQIEASVHMDAGHFQQVQYRKIQQVLLVLILLLGAASRPAPGW